MELPVVRLLFLASSEVLSIRWMTPSAANNPGRRQSQPIIRPGGRQIVVRRPRAARLAMFLWLTRYNTRRPHSRLGNQGPADCERSVLAATPQPAA